MAVSGCTVVVATYNRQSLIEWCLPALLSQRYVPLEVIVVDDGSRDRTAVYLRTISDSRLRVITHSENRGLSVARNSGIAAARYPVIAFTDDDCITEPDWITQLCKPFADARVGLVMGQVFYVARGGRRHFPERVVQNIGAQWPKGCNMAYRREVFSRVGNFSNTYYRYQNEDTEMAIRAVAAGFAFRRVPEAVVIHQAARWTPRALLSSAHNAAVWPLLKRQFPRHYQTFGSPIRWGVVYPNDYLLIFLWPILVPLVLCRYLWHGGRDLKIFFAKWPAYFFLRRFHIYRAAIRRQAVDDEVSAR